jgi:glycosyltransferase involved in cell wall biosynthesis
LENIIKNKEKISMIYLDCTNIFTYPNYHTGVQRVTRNIASEASFLRDDVCWAALAQDNVFYELSAVPQKDDVPYSYKGSPIIFSPGDIYFVLDGTWNYQILEKLAPFKTVGLITGVMYYDLIPVLYDNSGIDPSTFSSWITETVKYSDFFACISEDTRYELKKWIETNYPDRNLDEKTLFSYKLGADFLPKNSDVTLSEGIFLNVFDKKSTYLYVATLNKLKNHEFLLDCFDILWKRFPYLKLCFVGREAWDKYEPLHRRMKNHPMYEKNLFWFSGLSDIEVQQAYKKSKFFLFPSFIEGFGLPLIEALYNGTPVLASDIPIFREIAGDSIGYFDPRDVNTLVEWIGKIEKEGIPESLAPFNFAWPSWRESAAELLGKINEAYNYLQTKKIWLRMQFNNEECCSVKIDDIQSLSVKHLKKLNGRNMVLHTFVTFLHRLPSQEEESAYFEKLQRGVPAISIISDIRFSREGKNINEPVKHRLWLKYMGRLLGKSNIIGHVARFFYALYFISATYGMARNNEIANLRDKIPVYDNLAKSVPVAIRELRRNEDELRRNEDELRERLEFIRRELLFEVRYGKVENNRNSDTEQKVKIVNSDKIEKVRLSEIRINMGCGHIALDGYINIDARDLPGVDIITDAGNLPFAENELDEIFSAHLLEHFPQEKLKRELLPYWAGLLRKGGIFRAVVPDAESMMRAYVKGNYPYEHLREVFFGAQDYSGDFHYNMFVKDQLNNLFNDVGLSGFEVLAEGRPNGNCLEMEVRTVKD